MRCSASLEELSAYLDGELDQARMAAVEEHICVCDSCRQELAGMRSLTRALGAPDEFDPGPAVRIRVARRLAMTEDAPEFTCARMQVSMSAMLDGELSPEEAQRLEAHLATCPACTAELMLFEKVSDSVRTIPEVEVPFGLERRIRTAITREERGVLSWRSIQQLFQPRLAPGMATALAGATLALGFWLGRIAPGGTPLAPVGVTSQVRSTIASSATTGLAARIATAARPSPSRRSPSLRGTRRDRTVAVASEMRAASHPVVTHSKPAPVRPAATPRTTIAARPSLPLEAPLTLMPAPPVIGAWRPLPEAAAPAAETPTSRPSEPASASSMPVPTQPAAPVTVASQPAPVERPSATLPPITEPERPRTGQERRARWWRKAGDDAKLAAESLRGGASNRAMTARIVSLPF